jgi:hypothetical protein
MGGEITPSKDPFRRWIGVELAIFTLLILHHIPTPFAGIDNRMTGSTVEAAASFFHKQTICTRFDRDTFHRFSIPFYAAWTPIKPLPGNRKVPWRKPFAHTPQRRIAVVVNCQQTSKALARHSRGTNADDKGNTIIASAWEDKNFPIISDDKCLFFAVDVAIALMELAHLGYRCGRHQMMFEMKKTIER